MLKRGFLAQSLLPSRGALAERREDTAGNRGRTGATTLPTRLVSVIIPAHNEARYLRRTLDALTRQNYLWLEVIVVANGCTDGTADVARSACQRLIVLSRKNLGVARNLGARMAKGEILIFLDADTILEPMAIRRIAESFTDEYAAGTVRGRPDNDKFRYHLFYGVKNALHRSLVHPGSSGVMVCWKKHFLTVGGFDEGLEVRENSELNRRLRRFGRYLYIRDITATTSMRRFENRGFARVAWVWLKLWAHSIFGDLHQRSYEPVR